MRILVKLIGVVALFLGVLNAAEFNVDKSHTNVGFSVKHMMISNVKGKFETYDAKIDFDEKTKKFYALSATIKTNSVDTANEKRDKHLRSADFFYSSKFPDMKFVMKSFKLEEDNEGIMVGDLTIRGVTKEVKLEVELNGVIKDFRGATRLGFTLEGEINRKDFGLKWNKALELGGVVVGEKVEIEVEVEAIKK
ncbi:polyisoprenoid-binding protein [Malaciobacter molluscorum LMG 25693]|uniref:Polyisoprenoid-binding protein n=1 Tax=Malaciobacter molluscorum LMG 25693 TaxID=870501 RepID=A0A2G1DG11_9BACT|nr:YceI family protein [Malaciobacter molluscorum]AXX91126.1 YceI-like domain-containing periplasmic protein [Malaciobacter molluscorum LMG 25693]PHO17429.1 polyisoprenoid-binding protein [Malaciobacter molluscorum LMG 25693]